MNAPKLWPALPLNSDGSCPPAGRSARASCVISLPVIVPTTRLTLLIGKFGADLLAALDGRLADVEQLRHVQRFLQAVILVIWR